MADGPTLPELRTAGSAATFYSVGNLMRERGCTVQEAIDHAASLGWLRRTTGPQRDALASLLHRYGPPDGQLAMFTDTPTPRSTA